MTRPKIRKVDTAKRKKKRKDLQKQLGERTSRMLKHPKECCVCSQPFERTRETVKSWMVVVREEQNIVRLTCPQCWERIEYAAKEDAIG